MMGVSTGEPQPKVAVDQAGAGFICIEPWHGFASPVGFEGELIDKPGMVVVPPGGTETFAITIRLVPALGWPS